MTAASTSRTQILDRIRSATKILPQSACAYADLPRSYVRKGAQSHLAQVELMIERLREYDADVIECKAQDLPLNWLRVAGTPL